MMKTKRVRHILLVLDSAQPFHRAVMSGVGAFVRGSELDWRLSISKRLPEDLSGMDGLITDAETPGLELVLPRISALPGVFIASAASAGLAAAAPRVCADNAAMIGLAIAHLRENGVQYLAGFSLLRYQDMPWARERLEAFREQAGANPRLREAVSPPDGSTASMQDLDWVRALPTRTGVVAVNDSAARELLQLCEQAGRQVPRDIAIVGIDNDPLVAALSPLPISSVTQPAEEIGRKAAELLRRRLQRPLEAPAGLAIAPQGVQLAATSSKASTLVSGALEFIDAQLGRCIKAQQVADFMGVSRATLERSFLTQLGVTVHDELLRRRIAQAKSMLARRELSTSEIARHCGFRTQQYMHVVFKREIGLSPAEFALHAPQVGEAPE
ncbi:AraC family transcriptional regulator [Uliginosibacterium aquaticum]|uniref:Substrate-binding domain-containing protein n=1 Tax=Uliginosibacterium aquaticum TaxID=2731212 RepID=A0ABX2IH02_9RHOO|nr:substrate-binding domain-containing protein [Uliginosibacterium aquaticum]NSL53636.1 substrate-binding domain-containing protein [Uliginosibacterium aquaticum]